MLKDLDSWKKLGWFSLLLGILFSVVSLFGVVFTNKNVEYYYLENNYIIQKINWSTDLKAINVIGLRHMEIVTLLDSLNKTLPHYPRN